MKIHRNEYSRISDRAFLNVPHRQPKTKSIFCLTLISTNSAFLVTITNSFILLVIELGGLKMREWKMRYGQKCKGGKCRSGKCGSR